MKFTAAQISRSKTVYRLLRFTYGFASIAFASDSSGNPYPKIPFVATTRTSSSFIIPSLRHRSGPQAQSHTPPATCV